MKRNHNYHITYIYLSRINFVVLQNRFKSACISFIKCSRDSTLDCIIYIYIYFIRAKQPHSLISKSWNRNETHHTTAQTFKASERVLLLLLLHSKHSGFSISFSYKSARWFVSSASQLPQDILYFSFVSI